MGNSLSHHLFNWEPTGNEFIRSLVKVILDEQKIIGNGEYMKENHEKIIDFKYPHEIEDSFDFEIAEEPESQLNLLEICRKTIAFSIKTNHPHYMNSLYGGVDQYGIAGAWLTEALNSSAAIWESSPVFAVMERHIIEFMGRLTGFTNVEGLFCPGGSMANCYAMLLARQQIYPNIKEKGIFQLPRMVMFASDQSHYSFCKMAILLGHGSESVIKVKSDDRGHMIPEELEKEILEAKAQNWIPIMVAATAGTTVFGAFDPLVPIGSLCRKYNLWFHVDGALGGTWLFSKKYRNLLKGLERADSFTWDFHKMASVPIYCSIILVNNRKDCFSKAFSLHATYLFQPEKYYDKGYDAGDQSIQCTRKVEAFKLFLFMKAHGLRDIEHIVNNVFDMARYFEREISNRPNFRLLFPESEGNNICFYFIPDAYLADFKAITSEQHSKIVTELKRRMMESGTMMVAYQAIEEKHIPACFRLTVSALPLYGEEDILFIVKNFEELGKDIVVDKC